MACGGTALAFYTCICNINSNIQNDRVVAELRIPVFLDRDQNVAF
jgi:predicted GNAT superfamily acetyltransferase